MYDQCCSSRSSSLRSASVPAASRLYTKKSKRGARWPFRWRPAGLGGFGGRTVLFDRLVEEAADHGGWVGADEADHGLAVPEDDDRGEALDAVLGGERLLGVDVDLGELDLAFALGGLGLDRGAEHAAGPAPGGPEVDHDRQLVRAFDHVVLEGLGGDVHLFCLSSYVVVVVPVTSAFSVASCACSEPQICSQSANTPSSAMR